MTKGLLDSCECADMGSDRCVCSLMARTTAHVVMPLVLTLLQMGDIFTGASLYKEINPADIRLRIREKLDTIVVTWKKPNRKINDQCYESNLQYKSQCDLDWLDTVLYTFNFTLQDLAKGRGKNYTFRVRMKYACLFHNWSAWTPEKHWAYGDILASCFKANTNWHIVITVVPVIFLLAFLAAQKQVRGLLLPKVPDPKHIYEDLLKIDQSQLQKTFKDGSVECVILKIEVVPPEKETEKEEAREMPAKWSTVSSHAVAGDSAQPVESPVRALGHSGYVCW